MNDQPNQNVTPVNANGHNGTSFRALAEGLADNSVHPVLVFGTQASGKTTMLQSLLRYPQLYPDSGISPRLGPTVLGWDPDGANRYMLAEIFYRQTLPNFISGQAAAPTVLTTGMPLFIPVDIEINRKGIARDTARFVFLDGMGEWYQKEGGVRLRSLPEEICYLLSQFSNPISVIFVAPCVMVDRLHNRADVILRDYSHECLAYTMDQYHGIRNKKELDNVLLLYTKWDAIYRPDDPSGHFGAVGPEFFYETVKDWPFALSKFSGLNELRPDAKAIMPYSASWMIDETTMIPQGDYDVIFNKYNRTLWNWLYGNASTAKGRGKIGRQRQTLFEDVVPPITRGKLTYQTVASKLLGLR